MYRLWKAPFVAEFLYKVCFDKTYLSEMDSVLFLKVEVWLLLYLTKTISLEMFYTNLNMHLKIKKLKIISLSNI